MTRRGIITKVTPSGSGVVQPPITTSLAFYGDFSSPSTVITSGKVETWGDSSGNARHVTQATAANRPTYNSADSAFNFLPTMTLDATDLLVNSAFPAANAITAYLVVKNPVAAANFGNYWVAKDAGPTNVTSQVQNDDGFFGSIITEDVDDLTLAASGTAAEGSPYVFATAFNNIVGGQCLTNYVNAVAGTTYLFDTAPAEQSGAPTLQVGDGPASPVCTIACLLLYPALHDATQVANVTAWLRGRYNF
jgi:hypothetical protein